MNLCAVIVVFKFLMSASVDTPASHRAFSLCKLQTLPVSVLFLGCGLVRVFLALVWMLSLVLSFCV
jgi:hypothetical protein